MSLSLATASQLACSSGLSQRTTGSTTDWKTIHGFCNGLSKLGQASVRAEASSWKTSSNSGGCHMRLQQFVEDKKEGQFSAMRLAFLLWAVGVFAVWAYASISAGELRGIPESVVTILGLLAGGKVVQRYGER